MSVRLTKKKQQEILTCIDQIITLHRGKIYVVLGGHHPAKIDRTTADEVQKLVGAMSGQLVEEIIPMLAKMLASEDPVLPLS